MEEDDSDQEENLDAADATAIRTTHRVDEDDDDDESEHFEDDDVDVDAELELVSVSLTSIRYYLNGGITY